MEMLKELESRLVALDNRNYKELKSVKGIYQGIGFQLSVDHIQGDPFSAPSAMRLYLDLDEVGLPDWALLGEASRQASCDFLQRTFFQKASTLTRVRGTGNSGLITIDRPAQEVLPRSGLFITEDQRYEVRFQVGMPAQGRRILGRLAATMLTDELLIIVEQALRANSIDLYALKKHCQVVEDAQYLRKQLADLGLVAFVADGSLLPRASGIDDRPLDKGVKAFRSPESLAITLDTKHRGPLRGMAIKKGITSIIGGGYHGKSTLLQAIQLGIYDHIPGDGREFVVTAPETVKIVSEPGRSIRNVNISSFLSNLPDAKDTHSFISDNASGSTSQAASFVEAVEGGCRCILIDEDQAAANFLWRDVGMRQLLSDGQEPIRSLSQKVDAIIESTELSLILVLGASSQFLSVSDQVIAMVAYLPQDFLPMVTKAQLENPVQLSEELDKVSLWHRHAPTSILAPSNRPFKVSQPSRQVVRVGQDIIDAQAVGQICHPSQLHAIGVTLVKMQTELGLTNDSLVDLAKRYCALVADQKWGALSDFPDGYLAMYRVHELLAVINRCRSLRFS